MLETYSTEVINRQLYDIQAKANDGKVKNLGSYTAKVFGLETKGKNKKDILRSLNTVIESKELYEFLVKGWVQILLIISGIAYFIQKGYELRLRKKEIKFSRLQENKILEIKSFYKSYQLLFLSLKQYAYQTEFGEHSDDISEI